MSTLKIATWNIQRGRRWSDVARLLAIHQVDLALLQECDVGMARSGNVHVPRKIAEVWPDADHVAAIEFEEHGLGNAEEVADLQRRYCPDELGNAHGLHCNAIVGRDLPHMTHEVALSEGREWREDCQQPRRGGRKALVARVRKIHFACVHLESRTTPEKRAGQLQRLLRALRQLGAGPTVIGGDLNCKEGETEPLFRVAADYGYGWAPANADVGRFAGRRLDWFLTRDVEVSNPQTIDAGEISDHDLMLLEVQA